MKTSIFLALFFLTLAAITIYVEIDNRKFRDNLPHPMLPVERPDAEVHTHEPEPAAAPPTTEPEPIETQEPTVDQAVHQDRSELIEDWRTHDAPPHEHLSETDPWSDFIQENQAKARGTWIGNPATMDPDELYAAEYNQLLEKFGDIPQVHTYMEYDRKFKSDMPLSLDEKITGLEAAYHLFPYRSTQKTLAFYKWQQANGGAESLKRITEDDLMYLQSLGITITQTPKGFRISTQ